MTSIRHAKAADFSAIDELLRLAFGRDLEARLVELLREGGYARASLVAEHHGELVGQVLFHELAIVTAGETLWALSLAPLAVRPDHQHQGIGSALVRSGLRVCRGAGHKIVVVVGEPGFYERFGFSPKLAEPLRSPYAGPHMMAVELAPDALAGVEGDVRYPPPFHQVFG